MAHSFTDSGLSALLSLWPATASAQPVVMYLGLFASQTSGTVPSRTAQGGAAPAGWTETPHWSDARAVISGNQWGAPVISGAGVQVTGKQVAFTATAVAAQSANGFFLATQPSAKAGDIPFYFSNFDDLTQISIASADVIQITPTIRYNISAGA